MRASHSKLILWFTLDKATLVIVVPDIVALLAQLEHPQLVISTATTCSGSAAGGCSLTPKTPFSSSLGSPSPSSKAAFYFLSDPPSIVLVNILRL
jgi:hypothetical protein